MPLNVVQSRWVSRLRPKVEVYPERLPRQSKGSTRTELQGGLIDEIRLALLHMRHHRFHLVRGPDDLHLLVTLGLQYFGVARMTEHVAQPLRPADRVRILVGDHFRQFHRFASGSSEMCVAKPSSFASDPVNSRLV